MKSDQGEGSTGNSPHSSASTTSSVGHRTSGEAGSTLTHESMAETGGSGGSGMTDDNACLPQEGDTEAQTADPHRAPTRENTADSGARGFQDTRSEQAGGTGTGLGTPETGANQNEEDLEAGRRE
ncbi:hypothetical protein GCM10027321_01850 [Massilia terrae]|uniref:Uncharacterized protein n=1 Tax=Massilia terrae TaxID=1811224 RepID=A0ABT2CTZ1_9BURK|nr:hypothetical protein [Massilia terrae]MCS0657453.1 hypothetical protein [Massilia terrae]